MPWVPIAEAGAEFGFDSGGAPALLEGSVLTFGSDTQFDSVYWSMGAANELAYARLRFTSLSWAWVPADVECGGYIAPGQIVYGNNWEAVDNEASDPSNAWEPSPVELEAEGNLYFYFQFNECGGTGEGSFLVEVWVEGGTLVANDDEATVDAGAEVTIEVLANDTLNGGPVSVGDLVGLPTVVSPPANGTAIVREDGTITYEPEPGFCGTDSFVYEIETTDEDTCLYADLPCMSDSIAYVQGAIPSWWPTVDPYDYEAGTTDIGGQNAGLGILGGLPALVSIDEYPLRCGEYPNLEVTFASPEIGPTQYIACLSLRCEDAEQELIVRDLTIDESQRPELELVDGFVWGETEELYLNFNSGGPTVIFAWDGGVNRYVLLEGEPDPSGEGDRAGTITVNNPVCFFFRWESEG